MLFTSRELVLSCTGYTGSTERRSQSAVSQATCLFASLQVRGQENQRTIGRINVPDTATAEPKNFVHFSYPVEQSMNSCEASWSCCVLWVDEHSLAQNGRVECCASEKAVKGHIFSASHAQVNVDDFCTCLLTSE